ncbi:MAG: chemotaxis protein CheA [Actinomycetota bacterium]
MDEIIGEFIVESYEGLDQLEQALMALEENPDDRETITEIFRILHTIKGACGFLAFDHLEKVAHRGETLLSLVRDDVLGFNDEIADALLATVDMIRSILETIEETEEEGSPDTGDLLAELERLSARPGVGGTPPPTPVAEAEEPEPAPEPAPVAEAPTEPEPAAAPADPPADGPPGLVFFDAPAPAPAATDPADASSETPTEAPPAAGGDGERLGDILVDDKSAKRDDVEIAAAEQSLGDSRKIGEILVDQGKAKKKDVEKAGTKQRKSAAESSIRVDVNLLNKLMNLVGELVLTRNQLMQLADNSGSRDFVGPSQRLSLITTELQESVMKTRMQPIGNVWSKLPRVVRDLANQFDKEIGVEMEGAETELDRTIIEAIKDPITHMVRNTADHGIESPAERVAAGKPAEGTLFLRADHAAGQVVIEIADDGKGIDPEMLKAKSVEKGVITAEQAETMSDTEALHLIFAAGFSTAAKVTAVSGRGVGMDVVRTKIEQIGGSVEISSTVGKGTTFRLKIPLTLAIIPALIVNSGRGRYAIPQTSLIELVRLTDDDGASQVESVHGAPVYRLRGRLLPLVFLDDLLGTCSPEDAGTARNIVVLQADDHQFGLVVDEIDDTAEIVVKPLGKAVEKIPYFSGATIMGDGSVSLILDVMGLATEAHVLNSRGKRTDALPVADDAAKAERGMTGPMLLVVSFTDGVKAAIRLDDIDRLEEFPGSDIEQSDHHMVVQYRGGVMPLLDLAQVMGHQSPEFGANDRLNVIVCARNQNVVGVVVDRVLDTVANARVLPGVGGASETAVIDGKVTDIIEINETLDRFLPSTSYDLAEVPV